MASDKIETIKSITIQEKPHNIVKRTCYFEGSTMIAGIYYQAIPEDVEPCKWCWSHSISTATSKRRTAIKENRGTNCLCWPQPNHQ